MCGEQSLATAAEAGQSAGTMVEELWRNVQSIEATTGSDYQHAGHTTPFQHALHVEAAGVSGGRRAFEPSDQRHAIANLQPGDPVPGNDP